MNFKTLKDGSTEVDINFDTVTHVKVSDKANRVIVKFNGGTEIAVNKAGYLAIRAGLKTVEKIVTQPSIVGTKTVKETVAEPPVVNAKGVDKTVETAKVKGTTKPVTTSKPKPKSTTKK